ncbi:alpha/beta hydrolase [Sphingomonas sp. MG17]|uniref:Alpha/beta hydrolase n=1 Tax=Sphingomonas tagetis TaxID=2949092 RepID=A0A9X2HIE6_9SPHN|nr:alpha/beta hydrolase [Sphingomonas tagetis]MCP3730192.1 alpha/beta hydrolase [Sphingomonas tagetis]
MATTIDRRNFITGAAALGFTGIQTANAQSQPAVFAPIPIWPPREHFMLWPGLPPGSPPGATPSSVVPPLAPGQSIERVTGIRHPHIGVFRPTRPDGRAMLVIPGGGYGFVALMNEGIGVARALNAHGITAFVLVYRLPGESWLNRADVPLQDAQRAMRLIRARAAAFGIDPAKLGVCGFSAGGHLAATLTVGHADPVYRGRDAADQLPARPACSGLIYPVTSFATAGTHSRSAANLLGPDPAPQTAARYDAVARVTPATPPLFLVHAMDDSVVGVAQSIAMTEAARRHKVPVEAHLLERGGHGFGASRLPASNPGAKWLDWFATWTATHLR